jgi:cytochrome c553
VNKMTLLLLLSGCLVIALPAKAGGDVAAGRDKSYKCANCHGDDGKGDEDSPSIAGMRASYFVTSMKEYQTGERTHKKMVKALRKLNDQDIDDLAAYYASLKCQ